MKLIILLSFFLILYNGSFAQIKKKNNKQNPQQLNIPQDDALNFYVIGDWGRYGGHNQADVATQMDVYAAQFDPEFIISTGDNFYTNGVASTQDPHWTLSFENIYAKGGITCPWYPILGNHDYQGNAQAQLDYSKISRRWSFPSRYYTFAQKIDKNTKARFVFLDTNPFVEKYHKQNGKYGDLTQQDTIAQYRWLDSVLANSKEEW
ncbi:MAG: metallophosphoesterase, partial [Cytophagales bacterium]